MNKGRVQLQSLTGLRGFAIILVLISHGADAGLLFSFLGEGFGKLGVMLFFILSGYLMGMLYYEKNFKSNIKEYLVARIARIVPLFFFVVFFSYFTFKSYPSIRYDIANTSQLAMNLLFLNGTKELWTIPVEFQFYAFFILTWSLSSYFNFSKRLVNSFLFVSVVISVAISVYIKKEYGVPGQLNFCLHYFLAGVFLYVYRAKLELIYKFMVGKNFVFYFSLLTLLFSVFSIPSFRKLLGLYIPLWFDPIIYIAMISFFLCSLYEISIWRFLNNRLLIFVGEISFGLYVYHSLVLYFLIDVLHGFNNQVLFFIMIVISLFISILSLIYFEKPFSKVIRQNFLKRG